MTCVCRPGRQATHEAVGGTQHPRAPHSLVLGFTTGGVRSFDLQRGNLVDPLPVNGGGQAVDKSAGREARLHGVYSDVGAPVVAAYTNGRVDLLDDNLQVCWSGC